MPDCTHGKEGCDSLIVLRRRHDVLESSGTKTDKDIDELWKAVGFIRNLLIAYGGITVVATVITQVIFKVLS